MADEQKRYDNVHYNPVSVQDSIGAIMLGIVSLALLAVLLYVQAENRRLRAALYRSGSAVQD